MVYMKQLGNLAIVCANRPDILLQIYNGYVSVHVGAGTERASMTAKWEEDEAISGFIHEINYGRYAEHERKMQNDEYQNRENQGIDKAA